MDPHFSFDTMSGFVTRFDDISDGNNDEYFRVFACAITFTFDCTTSTTTYVCDVDDVGDTDDPLGGQLECDFDTEDRKVIPIYGSTELNTPSTEIVSLVILVATHQTQA